jgi:hypothetical protein
VSCGVRYVGHAVCGVTYVRCVRDAWRIVWCWVRCGCWCMGVTACGARYGERGALVCICDVWWMVCGACCGACGVWVVECECVASAAW